MESESGSVVSVTHGLYSLWNSPGQNTGVGSHSLLRCIFTTQESNQYLLHCRWILYQLSYQGSPNSTYHLLKFSDLLFFGSWHPWDFSSTFKISLCVYLVKNKFTARNSRVSSLLYGLMWCYFVHLLSNSQIFWTSFCDISLFLLFYLQLLKCIVQIQSFNLTNVILSNHTHGISKFCL